MEGERKSLWEELSGIEKLPADTIYEALSYLDYDEILKVCKTSRKMLGYCTSDRGRKFLSIYRDPRTVLKRYYGFDVDVKNIDPAQALHNTIKITSALNDQHLYPTVDALKFLAELFTDDEIYRFIKATSNHNKNIYSSLYGVYDVLFSMGRLKNLDKVNQYLKETLVKHKINPKQIKEDAKTFALDKFRNPHLHKETSYITRDEILTIPYDRDYASLLERNLIATEKDLLHHYENIIIRDFLLPI